MGIPLSFLLLLSFAVFETMAISFPKPRKIGLQQNFYVHNGCPQVEQLVRKLTWSKAQSDPALGAKLLRVHYHDCFVRGCDGSLLLDTVGTPSEKDAVPNRSLGRFEVIDFIKGEVEKACPGKVSCADILALAARDAVSFPFKKPMWNVLTGRRDGRTSLATDIPGNLPSPFSDFPTLQTLFTKKGLNLLDLVALSGAHTIGEAHCGAFSRRLFNFTGKGDMDPSIDPVYAQSLKQLCPLPTNPATTTEMDPQNSFAFNGKYFTTVNQKKGLFQSDAALLNNVASAKLVSLLQFDFSFFAAFAKSMVKMGGIEVLTGTNGEIRLNCRVVNP